MTSKFTCNACKTEIVKENGAQPGCPACGFGWATKPSQDEHSPWTFPYPGWPTPYEIPTTYPGPIWVVPPEPYFTYTTNTSNSIGFKHYDKES